MNPHATPLVRVIDLWKQYTENGSGGGDALRGVHMEVGTGEIVALFGKSGSGKTTLLNLLAGLDQPSKGTIEIEGQNIENMGEKGRTELRRFRLGFVFQFFNLLPTLTIFENVFLSLELAGKADKEKAIETLHAVGLHGKESRYPYQLSGGEQQRVAIARAIVKEPALILADEPTGNLDTATGDLILDLLSSRCRASSTSLIIVSHTLLTCRYADRVLRMTDGLITEETANTGAFR